MGILIVRDAPDFSVDADRNQEPAAKACGQKTGMTNKCCERLVLQAVSGQAKKQPKNEEARSVKAGFSLQFVVRERRYAKLGNLLPMFYIERAVEPGVSALPHS